MKGAARVLDPTVHGGPLTTGSPDVLVNQKPSVRVGDHHGCSKHGPGPVVTGAADVLVNNRPMARETDLCLCAGAGSGPSGVGGAAGPYEGSASWDPEKKEARAKVKGDAWSKEGSTAGGLVKGRVAVGGVDADVGVGPGGGSGKGEAYGVKGDAELGDDDNNVGLSVKVLSAEAEGDVWAGEHDGKTGGSLKEKAGADAVALKGKSKQTTSVGDYAFVEESEVEIGKGLDGPAPPAGGWAYIDLEKGELCIGAYGEAKTPMGDVEVMKQYKFRWKPSGAGSGGGTGGPPNAIADGSADVLVG